MEIEDYIVNIQKFTNERLCEVIVANRYLGIMREEAITSMEELARRRTGGDDFQYEARIDELMATLPKFNLDILSILKSTKVIK